LKSKGAEATLASQWRVRYEQTVRENEQLGAALRVAEAGQKGGGGGAQAPGGKAGKDVNYAEKYQKIRDEYSLYRKEAKKILEGYKSQAALAGGGGGGGGGGGKQSAAYLKNVLVQYMSSASAVARSRMEPGIFMALGLGEAEVEGIRRRKREEEEREGGGVAKVAASWWGGT